MHRFESGVTVDIEAVDRHPVLIDHGKELLVKRGDVVLERVRLTADPGSGSIQVVDLRAFCLSVGQVGFF